MLGAGDIIREQDKTKSLHYEAYILVRETGEESCEGGTQQANSLQTVKNL